MESFYGRLVEQGENCSLGDEETTLIRDTFILNMIDSDTQKELLKETVTHTKALGIDIHMDMGAQNMQKINQILNTNAQSVKVVNKFQGRLELPTTTGTQLSTKTSCTPSFAQIVVNAGVLITVKYAQRKARSVTLVELSGILCRKPKKPQSQASHPQHTNVNQIDATTTKSDD